MYVLNIINKYLLQSQIWVTIMGSCLATFFMLEQQVFRYSTLILIFTTFFSGYLYTKFQDNRKLLFKILPLVGISGIFSLFLILNYHNEILLLKWMVIVAAGLIYNSFTLPCVIRKLPLIKIFYVGIVWGLINGWLIVPTFNCTLFFISSLYISALILPFDIRDIKEDNILTIPKLIGIQKTKYFGYSLLALVSIFTTFSLDFPYALALYLSCITAGILTYFSKPDYPDVYYSFGVELCCGLPLFFLLLLQ